MSVSSIFAGKVMGYDLPKEESLGQNLSDIENKVFRKKDSGGSPVSHMDKIWGNVKGSNSGVGSIDKVWGSLKTGGSGVFALEHRDKAKNLLGFGKAQKSILKNDYSAKVKQLVGLSGGEHQFATQKIKQMIGGSTGRQLTGYNGYNRNQSAAAKIQQMIGGSYGRRVGRDLWSRNLEQSAVLEPNEKPLTAEEKQSLVKSGYKVDDTANLPPTILSRDVKAVGGYLKPNFKPALKLTGLWLSKKSHQLVAPSEPIYENGKFVGYNQLSTPAKFVKGLGLRTKLERQEYENELAKARQELNTAATQEATKLITLYGAKAQLEDAKKNALRKQLYNLKVLEPRSILSKKEAAVRRSSPVAKGFDEISLALAQSSAGQAVSQESFDEGKAKARYFLGPPSGSPPQGLMAARQLAGEIGREPWQQKINLIRQQDRGMSWDDKALQSVKQPQQYNEPQYVEQQYVEPQYEEEPQQSYSSTRQIRSTPQMYEQGTVISPFSKRPVKYIRGKYKRHAVQYNPQ